MPYISPSKQRLCGARPQGAGELTFIITKFVAGYLEENGLSFEKISECIAALECTKLELYRRVVAPYENKKIRENGDVYPEAILTKEVG